MSSQEQNEQPTSRWKRLFCSLGSFLYQSRGKIKLNFYFLIIVVIFIQVQYKSEETSQNFSTADIKQAFLQKYGERKLPGTSQTLPGIPAFSKPIDLNSANQDELDVLPGIGIKLAKSIIQYREEKGGFTKPEELLEIRGIGPKNFEKLKDKVIVGPVMACQTTPETELQSRSSIRSGNNETKEN